MSGDLKWNKIAGAGLATVFGILIINQGAELLFHTEAPEKMGYFIDVPEEAAGGGGAAEELAPDWGTILPVADLGSGERAFARCVACHTINQGGADGIGPNLFGVMGSAVANNAGYAYSDAMRQHAAQAPTWTYDEMDAFLTAPGRHVPGTKMSFAGLRNTDDRVSLIAWLRTQGSGGYAIPAPDPSRQPGAAEEEAPVTAEGDLATAGAPEAAGQGGGPAGQTPDSGPGAAPVEEATTPGGQQN